MTYLENLAPAGARSRRPLHLRTVLLAALLAAGTVAAPAAAQPPAGAGRPGLPDTPGTDRAAIRAEAEVARSLVRLDEELDLRSYPDVSPLWPARMAAAIEARDAGAPAQALLLQLARELRALGARIPFGPPPDLGPDDLPAFWERSPSVATPTGRERAVRIARVRDLVERVRWKLGFADSSADTARGKTSGEDPASPRIGRRAYIGSGGDDCASPIDVGLGHHNGYTDYSTNDGGSSCDGPTAPPDSWARFTAPEDGTYTFRTSASYYNTFDTVLSLHSGCPSGGDDRELTCSDDTADSFFSSISWPMIANETVLIRIAGYGGAAGDFTLSVELGRKIEGTVTRESDGAPLSGIPVEAVNYWGDLLATTVSRADGSYTVALSSLEADEVYARAGGNGYLTEVYEGLDCVYGAYCSPSYGTELDASTADLSGIDFTLQPGGTISGHVRSAENGEGLDGYTYLYDSDGTYVANDWHNDTSDGEFAFPNVAAGTYYLLAQGYGHQSEVWDDVACDDPCDPTLGTPIVISEGSTSTDRDFLLDPQGSIEGTVTLEGSGDPAAQVYVRLYDDNEWFADGTYTASDGTYRFAAVSPEPFRVATSSARFYDEVYDDVPCEPSCDLAAGTAVQALAGETASGIDFALAEKAKISGTVIAATTEEPLHWEVRLYDDTGSYVSFTTTTPETGEYAFYGLEAGTYYVTATINASYYSSNEFEPQLYQGIFCNGCDVTTGTPVAVATDADVSGIDFALTPRGSISGRVTDLVSGASLEGVVFVRAFNLSGGTIASGGIDSEGNYEIANVPRGDYRVGTVSDSYYDDHLDEMWDDVPCGVPCDRTTGQVVTVRSGRTTEGIDFALRRLGSISGQVFDTADSWYGPYVFRRLLPGTYYVRANDDYDWGEYQQEVYPDVPCDPDCDPTLGTPIVVTYGSLHENVDFHLTQCPAPSFGEVISTTVSTYLKVLACETITASEATVGFGGDLLLRAGKGVVFGDGFSVEEGGSLRVVIEPDWADD